MGYTPKKRKTPVIRFWVVTLFPEIVEPYVHSSILGRAHGANYIQVTCINPRDFTVDPHRTVDDKPFGGGPGMVMTAEPILCAVDSIHRKIARKKNTKTLCILTSPGGELFTNTYAQKLISNKKPYTDIIILCGRYEGIDSRISEILGTKTISIGGYVLTGGELPALIMIDCITRRIPGVLPKLDSLEENRVSSHKMYTRPEVLIYNGKKYTIPAVLKTGNHTKIEEWRRGIL